MTKRLVKHGNSLALVIDKPILELLNIDADTPLSVTTDGKHLVVSRADARVRAKLDAAFDNTVKKYAKMLKRLAK
jgi:antitoxin component of MazEF toxin-antitoxin module